MDVMSGIASAAMNMKAAQFSQNYAIAVEAKALDAIEQMGNEMLELMNSVSLPKGEFIDVYA